MFFAAVLCRRLPPGVSDHRRSVARYMYVGTGVSTLNDTLDVKPLLQLQTARGDPPCLCDARDICMPVAKRYLWAPVGSGRQPWSSRTACERCLRFWTSHLDDQSVLSLKDTSSRSLCGPTNDVEPKDTVAKTNTRSRVLRPPSAMKI